MEIQTRAQDTECRITLCCCLCHARHTAQDAQPIEYGGGWPEVRFQRDAVQHGGLRRAESRQGIDGGELAHREVGGWQGRTAYDLALHEIAKTVDKTFALRFRYRPTCFVGDGEHIRSQGVFAGQRISGEVLEQAVAIHVGGECRHLGVPGRAIMQGDSTRQTLLQAVVWVAAHVRLHTVQTVTQLRM